MTKLRKEQFSEELKRKGLIVIGKTEIHFFSGVRPIFSKFAKNPYLLITNYPPENKNIKKEFKTVGDALTFGYKIYKDAKS